MKEKLEQLRIKELEDLTKLRSKRMVNTSIINQIKNKQIITKQDMDEISNIVKLNNEIDDKISSITTKEVWRGTSKPKTFANPNISIVDFLNSKKINSSFANRKKLAESLGIENYKGSADQNIKLIKLLKEGNNEPVVETVTVKTPSGKSEVGEKNTIVALPNNTITVLPNDTIMGEVIELPLDTISDLTDVVLPNDTINNQENIPNSTPISDEQLYNKFLVENIVTLFKQIKDNKEIK